MKWAESPTGPWFEFDLGGVFNGHTRRGIFDPVTDPTRDVKIHAVASSDVHVDHDAEQIVMFFHGET